MKKSLLTRILLLSVAICSMILAFAFSGCDQNNSSSLPGGNSDYTVTLESAGHLPLSNVTVMTVKDGQILNANTDEFGQVTLNMPSGEFTVSLTNVPEGYSYEPSYTVSEPETTITLTSSVISSPVGASTVYTEGSIVHDFTVTDVYGETVNLKSLVETHSAVLINFWYLNCSWCIKEFPYMQQAYAVYSDDIAIVALDVYSSDALADIISYKESNGLGFTMAYDSLGLMNNFGITGCPTTAVIDRYGMIVEIESGAIVSYDDFAFLFECYIGDDYKQVLGGQEPDYTPTVDAPSIAQVNAAVNPDNYDLTIRHDETELNWPFIIGGEGDGKYIYPSNSKQESSYSIIYIDVHLNEGDTFAFDYRSYTEAECDIFYIFVDNEIVQEISGVSEEWQTRYAFTALRDGDYEIALSYVKDSDTDESLDTVHVRNFKIVDESEIDNATYMRRSCAQVINMDTLKYEYYVTPVYNEEDGYYHVNSANGPLILVDLLHASNWSNSTVYDYTGSGYFSDIFYDEDYTDELTQYAQYCSNSANGYCPINQELYFLLSEIVVTFDGGEVYEEEWLELCYYFDSYGTDEELANPIMGLANFCAYTATLGRNSVNFTRPIMPRGLKFAFTPTVSSTYRITADSTYETLCWLFDEDGNQLMEAQNVERFLYTESNNFSMVYYMEAGVTYYVVPAFYDMYQYGTLEFIIEDMGAEYSIFRVASMGPFTTATDSSNADDLLNGEIIAGGVDVIYCEDDGYYHVLNEDGTMGSVLYADFLYTSAIFPSQSLKNIAQLGAFNFLNDENDSNAVDSEGYLLCVIEGENGESLTVRAVDKDGNYILAEDLTELALYYADLCCTDENSVEHGTTPVTAELANLLQLLMDKYTFRNDNRPVDHSWTKLCYYYEYFGANA